MTREIDIAERQALAQPRDFPDDMREESACWNVCGDCLRCFVGIPARIQCRVCQLRKTL